MRRHRWTAEHARSHCQARRSLVAPNDGFWRALCALEGALGLTKRWGQDCLWHSSVLCFELGRTMADKGLPVAGSAAAAARIMWSDLPEINQMLDVLHW